MAGCVSTTPRFDRQFGDAVRTNLAAQVLNPAAAANPNPAAGIDGRAARGAEERYEKSYAQPEPAAPALIIKGQ
jgi:type IV pilus biogenesis protein CpaD/CtpE